MGGEPYSVALVANADHVEIDTSLLELRSARLCLLDSVRVVATAETTVASDANHQHLTMEAECEKGSVCVQMVRRNCVQLDSC